MKILFVSVEFAPFAKVGGLADVAGSLPKALKALGHDVRIVMPAYGMVVGSDAKPVESLTTHVNAHDSYSTKVYKDAIGDVPVVMINCDEFFKQTQKSEELYAYGKEAYLYFSAAVIQQCESEGWIPDVVHANDWHTGFLPVFIREKASPKWDNTASIFTIHNLKYQGEFDKDTLRQAGLPESLFTMEKLETFGGVNFIKSACVYADKVNTVSPSYADEITTPEYGAGQWGLMGAMRKSGKLSGILNGIDTEFFNPTQDPVIAAPFNSNDLSGKAKCKEALQTEFGLPTGTGAPLLGIVSRLSDQKGFDLIIKQAYGMLALGCQFFALGTGDPWAAEQLRQLQEDWPDQVRFIERYDAPLANKIYAGSDMFLMPSAFEPCGLGQMIACAYGTVPIVRQTGGLADSIFDGKNGFVFEEKSARVLLDTIQRALSVYKSGPEWEALVQRCMNTDFSWDKSAKLYVELYMHALQSRSLVKS